MRDIYYRIYNKIFSAGERRIKRYEAACLHAFWCSLALEERRIFEEQLRRYDRVQRSPNGKHVGFFDNESDGLCKTWPREALFRLRSQKPIAAAKVFLSLPERRTGVEAEMFVFAGRFAGIEFLKKPPLDGSANEEIALAEIRVSDSQEYGPFIERYQLLCDLGQET